MERFLEYFVPEKYELNIGVDKINKKIGGVVIVKGEVKSETVKFHAVGLEVAQVLVDGKKIKFEVADGVLTLFKVPLGDVEVIVGYNGSLNENMEGAYLSTYDYRGGTEVIVATQFESHYAREAFPCIDEPAAKAVFELSISLPKESDDIVLSNMPVKGKLENTSFEGVRRLLPRNKGSEPREDGREEPRPENECISSLPFDGYKTVSFQPTPRMSTYLLAWVIGKFHGKTVKNKYGVEITTYCSSAQDVDSVDFANEVAAKSLEFYNDNFGVPYPLTKCTQVALPDFEAGAMENWGLVTYRESMLLAGKNATIGTNKSVALTVAHELSHQWFGDLVTMKWWDDLWLNESFASVMEYYAVDAIYPEFKIWEGFYTGDSYAALLRDAYTDVQSVHQEVNDPAEIATLFDGAIVYSKGARLMLMLIRLMGWEKFCEGIREYFDKYQYQNTVGDNLWDALAPYADFEPKKLMHSFIERPGYPVVTGDDGFGKYEQRRFLLDGEIREKSDWPIPEVTEDMSGHYVLNLSDEQFRKRLDRFDSMELEEKIRLLIDRNLVARAGLVSSDSLIDLIWKFRTEESAAVWNVIVSIVASLKMFFEPGSDEEKSFKKFVGELVAPGILRIGLVTKDSDDENVIRLRAILLGLDYYAENTENLEALAKMYNDDLGSLDSEIREDILDAKLYLEPEMVDEYIRKYKKEVDPEVKSELLYAGTIVKNRNALMKVMRLLEQPDVVKPQDQLHLFIYLYRNSVVRNDAFEWLTKHWDYVREMGGDKTLENYPRYTAGVIRTEQEYADWKKFFEPMADDLALARAIKIGRKEIEARLKLIAKNQKKVYKAIADYKLSPEQ